MTDLLVDQCAHCRPIQPADPFDEPSTRGPWFTAGWPGECSECGDRLDAGEQIKADGSGGYVCPTCGEQ